MRSLYVVQPGPLATVQDAGRPGFAHLGVPRSGALDVAAYELANRLVGNPAGLAALEATFGGLVLRADAVVTVAVTGALAALTVAGRECAWGEPVPVGAGELVEIGPPRWGVRSYLGVSGGIAAASVLGSRSTDTLSGIGPEPLRAGLTLGVGTAKRPPRPVDVAIFRPPPQPHILRMRLGPRDDWFGDRALRTLAESEYVVSHQSNRVAVRLRGETLPRRYTAELPSEGIVSGSVQVPSDGAPLVFLNDHPTTGGYPVVGVVDADALSDCAQLGAGDRVRFAPRAEAAGRPPAR
jgi:biotin-dependent carboxylase-like uncharacterized protein